MLGDFYCFCNDQHTSIQKVFCVVFFLQIYTYQIPFFLLERFLISLASPLPTFNLLPKPLKFYIVKYKERDIHVLYFYIFLADTQTLICNSSEHIHGLCVARYHNDYIHVLCFPVLGPFQLIFCCVWLHGFKISTFAMILNNSWWIDGRVKCRKVGRFRYCTNNIYYDISCFR